MAEDYESLKKEIEDLRKEIGKIRKGLEGATSAASSFVSKIGEGNNLFQSMVGSVKSLYNSLLDFSTNLQEQYQLGEQLAKSFKQTSVNIGIGTQNQKILGSEFNKSVMLVEKLGGNMDDVSTIYSKFADQSGRVRILDDEEVQRIFAIEQATGLMGDSAASLAERFDLVGIGSEEFAKNIDQIMVDSQKMGLNSSKVVKVLSDNFESMQRMSFRGGVKSMTEMSKLAVKMRMEISDMLGMADKFYEPENAIEAAAQMQLLGGDIANAFGDPIQMMYEARNAPEEFMKRVGDATEGMVKFNEETGQFDMVAENRQKLIGMADALGINKDQLIDTAFQMSKMQKIKMDVGGNLFEEETMDKIASLAKFDKTSGQWSVDVGGEMKSLEELKNTPDLLEKALQKPTTEKDAAIKTAEGVMTSNEHLAAIEASTKTGIIIETDVYGKVEKQMSDSLVKLKESNSKMITEFAGLTNKLSDSLDMTGMGDKLSNVTKDITEATIEGLTISAKKAFEDAGKKIDTLKAKNLIIEKKTKESSGEEEGIGEDVLPKGAQDLFSGPGKSDRVLTGSFGSFKLDSRDLIAAGDPKKLLSSVNSNQKLDVSGTINFGNINITMDGNSENISFTEQDKKEMMKSIKSQIIAGVNGMIGANKVSGKDSLMMG
jgi:hypothetical protein